jgi:hypothetical protein
MSGPVPDKASTALMVIASTPAEYWIDDIKLERTVSQ